MIDDQTSFESQKDYYIFQLLSLIDTIEEEYPNYQKILKRYWRAEYSTHKNEAFPEDVIDVYAMSIANQKLREYYTKIENSILGELKNPIKRYQFELDHFNSQKKFLMDIVNKDCPSAIGYAENLWKDAYDDAIRSGYSDERTYHPEYLYANKELRKFCAQIRKN